MQALKHTTRIDRDGSSPRANMQVDVVTPAFLVAGLGFLAVFGLTVFGLIYDERLTLLDLETTFNRLLGACALALVPSMGLATIVAWTQLMHYRAIRVQQWHFKFDEEAARPQGNRQIRQPPDMPNTWRVGAYTWNRDKFQRLVDKMFDQSGEWVGGPQVTRDVLKAAGMKRLTSSGTSTTIFADIVDDMRSWGWIDDRNYWTPHGKESLWLEIHPPPWPGRSSNRPAWLDDDGRQE